jgi:hypothetical protein
MLKVEERVLIRRKTYKIKPYQMVNLDKVNNNCNLIQY